MRQKKVVLQKKMNQKKFISLNNKLFILLESNSVFKLTASILANFLLQVSVHLKNIHEVRDNGFIEITHQFFMLKKC